MLPASGSGKLGGSANSDLNWGGSSPISAHGVGGGSGYVSGSLGYGSGQNNFGLGGSNYGRSSGTGSDNTSFAASSGGFEGNYLELYGGNSVYGDPTWRSGSSDLDNSGPFSYGLGNSTTDATAKSSAGYIGGYTVTNRQPNRVSQLHASLSDGRAVHEKKRAKCSQEQPASNLQLKNLICRKCWQVILGCTPLSVFSGNKGRRKLDGKPAYLSRAIKNKAVLFFLGGYILFRRSMHEHTSGHLRTSQEKKRAKYSQGQPTGSQQLRHSSP